MSQRLGATQGLTVIAILADVQGVTGVALALAFLDRGIELPMRSRPIRGLLGLAVGALLALGPALYLVLAWGRYSLRVTSLDVLRRW